MQNPLERYVDSIGERLNTLPPAQRESELAEIRAHLYLLAEAHQEMGATEEEAAAHAIAQFGTEKTVANGIQRTALRSMLDTPLGALGCIIVADAIVQMLTMFIGGTLFALLLQTNITSNTLNPAFEVVIMRITHLLFLLASGIILQSITSKSIWHGILLFLIFQLTGSLGNYFLTKSIVDHISSDVLIFMITTPVYSAVALAVGILLTRRGWRRRIVV